MTFSGTSSELAVQLRALDVDAVGSASAVALLDVFLLFENMGACGKSLMIKRIVDTNAWQSSGASSAVDFVAGRTKASLSSVHDALRTARRLADFPRVDGQWRSGLLSAAAASAIGRTAAADADAARNSLKDTARDRPPPDNSPGGPPGSADSAPNNPSDARPGETSNGDASPAADAKPTPDEAAQQRSGPTDEELSQRAQQAERDRLSRKELSTLLEQARGQRYAWVRTNSDTHMTTMFLSFPTAEAGDFVAAIAAEHQRVFRSARASGLRESSAAYRADAIVNLLSSSGGSVLAPKRQALITVDLDALLRGYGEGTEVFEITGLGFIPVSLAERLLGNAYTRFLITKGAQLLVCDIGRSIPPAVSRKVMSRHKKCAVPGCSVSLGLELDHRRPVSDDAPSSVENLAPLCRMHHYMKTHQGWCLVGPLSDPRFVRRRWKGDGGMGYPLDHDEDPSTYVNGPPSSSGTNPNWVMENDTLFGTN